MKNNLVAGLTSVVIVTWHHCQIDALTIYPEPHQPVVTQLPRRGGSLGIATRSNRAPIVTMLLLDYQNVLIQSVLTERFSGYG